MSNFSKRALTTVIGGAFMIGVIYFGGSILLSVLLFASIVGYRELAGAFHINDKDNGICSMEIAGYAFCVIWYVLLEFHSLGYVADDLLKQLWIVIIVIMLMAHMSVYVFSFPRYNTGRTVGSFFSVIYCPVMMSFIYMIRAGENGRLLVWLVFICSWVCDICAYLVGVKFGKTKMSPVLSPKKSVEGAVGGVAGSVIAGSVYAALVIAPSSGQDTVKTVILIAIISLCGALISMVGDLAASAIKRDTGIKDYGNLLPGHGGIMDRFDSVIFVAPLVYVLCDMILK